MKLINTINPPVGRFMMNEPKIPIITEIVAKQQDAMMVALKLRATWSAETAGSISRAEMSMMPTTFMARTTVSAVISTSTVFMVVVRMPEH